MALDSAYHWKRFCSKSDGQGIIGAEIRGFYCE